jgi:predicted lipid-binding transport protein (Tim44 family)
MLRKLFSSKKFIIGLGLILIAFFLMILQSYSDLERIRDCSYPTAQSSYSYSNSYSNTGEKELRQKINEKIDRIIEIIDELSD